MDTPRARSPRALRPRSSSKPTAPLPPPPQPPLSVSAATSPSRDFSFALPFSQSACSSPAFAGHLHPLFMSRAPVGRVGSDLSHSSYSSKASTRHPIPTTSYGTGSREDYRDRAKNNRTPPFFGGFDGGGRKESSRSSGDTAGGGNNRPAEEKKKDKAKRALDVGQWVKRYMAAMVEQLRSSFHGRYAAVRDHHRRQRPHSFSGRGPSAAREVNKEQERWTRRRGQRLSSAPASLRVSPSNSGHLSVGASVKVSTSSEESTMQELQSAIEAAIAHCKNSNARAAR